MRNKLGKIGAIAMSIAMAAAMVTPAFAAPADLTNGVVGVGGTSAAIVGDEAVNIKKELKVYNLDENSITAPTISYTYTIAAGTANQQITDADNVSAKTKAGIMEGVKVGGAAGASGTIAWTTAERVNADTDGEANIKNLAFDFSGVDFGAAGVYRYTITEALTSGNTYAGAGVTETKTNSAAGSHVRYLDVYVKDGTGASGAAAWDVYGFVCSYNDVDGITPTNAGTSPVKTEGFVAGTTDGSTALEPDSYYTFNVEISKTVENDAYIAGTHQFPFTVLFTNSTVSQGTIVTNGASDSGTDFTHSTAVDLSSGALKGIAKLKSGQSIKYVGIPAGTSVEVYETNDVDGTTYKATTVVDGGTPAVDNAIDWAAAPAAAVAQAAQKGDAESTKATITTTADQDDDVAHSVGITNEMLLISPTGVAFRVAPYVLMLAAGLMFFAISRRRALD